MQRKIMILLLLSFMMVGLSAGGARSDEIANNYGFEKGLRLARILDRQFVFSFLSSSCPHCQDFKDNILSNQTVKNILEDHFVLSLVSVDSEFEIELPEKGEVTNLELASSLGVEATPTTYFFYPPDPGLSGNGIVKIPGNVPNFEDMVNLLKRALSESFEEGESREGVSYNYRKPIKNISEADFEFLQKNFQSISVVSEKVQPTSLSGEEEIILDFASGEEKEYANRVLEETSVKKIYVVSGT